MGPRRNRLGAIVYLPAGIATPVCPETLKKKKEDAYHLSRSPHDTGIQWCPNVCHGSRYTTCGRTTPLLFFCLLGPTVSRIRFSLSFLPRVHGRTSTDACTERHISTVATHNFSRECTIKDTHTLRESACLPFLSSLVP